MRAMNLNTVKARLLCNAGGPAEAFDHGFDLVQSHRAGLTELAARQAQRDRTWRSGARIDQFWRLASGMADLHDHCGAMRFANVGPAREHIHLFI